MFDSLSLRFWMRPIRRWFLGLCIVFGLLLPFLWGSSSVQVSAQGSGLVVLRQGGGSQNWAQISQQLEQGSFGVRVLDREELSPTGLSGVETLLLPTVGRLSAPQAIALADWLEEGSGSIIVSGPLEYDPDVDSLTRQRLRALIGAYWSGELPVGSLIQPTGFAGSNWAQGITASALMQGGSLLPDGIQSRLVAQWADADGLPYAVIATPRSVYLGWRWGSSPTDPMRSELDRVWMTAALNFLSSIPVSSTAATVPAVAPPQPLNTFEMLGMRQELSSLLGRVESALLVTRATQPEATISADFAAALDAARDVVRQLPAWVESGQHQQARQAFEQARANLWANYPSDRLSTLPEVRAIWLDRGTIVEARSEQGLVEVFDRLAAAGINTIFFETVNAGYTIYPSRVAPQQNPLTRSWDPLRAGVKLAHERGMELHPWLWTFAVGNRRHNVLPEINLSEDYIGPVLTAHPSWANYDDRGEWFPRGQPETWIDPANPEVRRYILSLVEEIAGYGVDGIHLDYIRYPFQNAGSRATFGYGQAARQGFQQLTGVDPQGLDPSADRSLWRQWTAFRAQQVSEVVADVSATLQRINPQIILSTAVYGLPENERIQKLQQDWEHWISRGDVDLLVPMTYAGNTRRLAQLVEPNLEIVRQSPVLFLPSVNLLELPKVEFLDQMQVVRDLPTGGYAMFAARQLTDELQGLLQQSAISSSQIPYRDPFGAARDRFAGLKQEWDFLLEMNELGLRGTAIEQWQTSTQQVMDALDQLVGDPSPDRLSQARQVLAQFQAAYSELMRTEALSYPYRVNTWANRLDSVEILLRYGERVVPRFSARAGLEPKG